MSKVSEWTESNIFMGDGSKCFQGWVQVLIPIEIYKTCDFPWRGSGPHAVLWVRAWTIKAALKSASQ